MTHALSTTTEQGLSLRTFDEAARFAKLVAGTVFAPKGFDSWEKCLLAQQHGAELGMGPLQSLQSLAVINGKPAIYGDAAIALVQASPVCEFVEETIDGEGDSMVATCRCKRRNWSTVTVKTFSVADAKKAKLWGKSGPWTEYPQRMLQMRARGFALRDAFADVLRGLITAEEAADIPTVAAVAEPVKVRPAKETPPPEIQMDDAETIERAKDAIYNCQSQKKIIELTMHIQRREKEGFFSADVAADLLNLADLRYRDLKEEASQEVTA